MRFKSAETKNMDAFPSGLIIGSYEGAEMKQRRKEVYRQELLQQIAENHTNKKREKELELLVAASGVTDPEKQPDRLRQFGAVRQEYQTQKRDEPYNPGPKLDSLGADSYRQSTEKRISPGVEKRATPLVAFPPFDNSAILDRLTTSGGLGALSIAGISGVTSHNQDIHKSLVETLGEMIAPRITGAVPPVLPPVVSSACRSPYDDVYYHYGVTSPLEPHLPIYGRGTGKIQHPHSLSFPPLHSQRLINPGLQTQMPGECAAAPTTESTAGSGPRLNTESALSYLEVLKQQIREQQERRRHEKEENERYNAKVEAEMKAYNPWGRGGGGAPLKDKQGNLISDLKWMHKTNEEAYLYPDVQDRNGVGNSPQATEQVHLSMSSNEPMSQQRYKQDKYRDDLRQQIEEKRQAQMKERKRIQLEDEREEKRLAEQRARIQREFEEEQRKQSLQDPVTRNQASIHQAEEQQKAVEQKRDEAEEEEDGENSALQLQWERHTQLIPSINTDTDTEQGVGSCHGGRTGQENGRVHVTHKKRGIYLKPDTQDIYSHDKTKGQLTPPTPAQRKRVMGQQTSRPPSGESGEGPSTPWPSAPPTPVPARWNQLRENGISEMSALSRRLCILQRKMDSQRLLTGREELDSPIPTRRRGPPPVDVSEEGRVSIQVVPRKPSPRATKPINIHNIFDFNQLKCRESASRKEVQRVFPDPPTDGQSLELQQESLIQEQQRVINNMRARTTVYSGNDVTGQNPSEQRANQIDEDLPYLSLSSFNIEKIRERNQGRLRHLEEGMEPDRRSEERFMDEGDYSCPPSPLPGGRVSVDTIDTEPWLRPGTTETLKSFLAMRRWAGQDATTKLRSAD
ncbi:centrosome and spindle pole-associated protein 1-like isoform X2 [Denticeps clupeoides]|uniref:centrosome and spindle pole-associated protein 1-like isoform X2 n=1 Tax=Denticeps clupeoides TaxID=299321 RepID=UPI0010A3BC7B|nr:centrosome and spindle pole-associated protein 1-like isoform X2 [Denticeps clupeoides]